MLLIDSEELCLYLVELVTKRFQFSLLLLVASDQSLRISIIKL